jgi:hypothetical protein
MHLRREGSLQSAVRLGFVFNPDILGMLLKINITELCANRSICERLLAAAMQD